MSIPFLKDWQNLSRASASLDGKVVITAEQATETVGRPLVKLIDPMNKINVIHPTGDTKEGLQILTETANAFNNILDNKNQIKDEQQADVALQADASSENTPSFR
ncbi:hypothetical protein BN59_01191 [Legionella massiliensis]|uniref:Uncharacterized protein n=1 Tax=Legionella massiliensis TaxID=1034943 RepID=A0A078KVC1_9GAMM|nr:hypothetical protein [Legionella massiliensis]CDZ76912.1 hypothetical protein BN59_01191 [Legionella massiliensis]CEE12650.1 hypothetical protein BN1094_01191 [Legionella massiliensis]